MNTNGEPKHLPGIVIGFDAAEQDVHLKFDTQDFKKFPFLIAVLEMAVAKAKQMHREAQIMQMQQQAAEAEKNAQIAQLLKKR